MKRKIKLGDSFTRTRKHWVTNKNETITYYYVGGNHGEHLFITLDAAARTIHTDDLKRETLELWGLVPVKKSVTIIPGRKRVDDYKFMIAIKEDKPILIAGCRRFGSLKRAKSHWSDKHLTLRDNYPSDEYTEWRRKVNKWSVSESEKLFGVAERRIKDRIRKRRKAAKK